MFINRAEDRKFALSLVGTLMIAIIIILALAPPKVRAHVADAFAKIGARRFASIVAGDSGTSRTHSAVSLTQNRSDEDGPAGSSFEVPAIWSSESWSPGATLARAVFTGVDGSGRDPFLQRPGLPGSLMDGWQSAPDGWASRQGSGLAAGGGTSGHAGASSGAAGGGLGGGISSGAGYTAPAVAGGAPGSRSSDSVPVTPAKTISYSSHGGSPSTSDGPASDLKSLVTASDSSSGGDSGLPGDVLDAQSLTPGSGWQYRRPRSGNNGNGSASGNGNGNTNSGNGNGWTPGGDSGDTTSSGGNGTTPSGNQGGSGNTGGGSGHKGNSSDSNGDYSGPNQNGQGNPPPVNDFSNITNFSSLDTTDIPGTLDGTQAVPEPSAAILFGTALLGVAAFKLRRTRKA